MTKTVSKIIGLALFFGVGGVLLNAWSNSGLSTVEMNGLAVANVNGGDSEFITNHSFVAIQRHALLIWGLITLIASWFLLKSDIKGILTKTAMVAMLCMIPFLNSCKPYQKPVYKEVLNNETAFVIPLEGDVSKQAKFDSADFLEKHKVGTKRIEIPTRWDKQGRGISGAWIPTVTVIIVDRSPVTRNWDAGQKGKDTAIWVESSDSVGFSMGFNCTAFIKEADTSMFLYWYSSGSLSQIMDSEIRGRIQQIAAEESAKYPLDELRNKKNEIASEVKKDIVPFFAERGITITTIGMFGGMTYENPKIQESIDNVFVAQQEKNVSLAKYDAQKKENERVILEAEGVAKQREIQSEAEAKAIVALTKAVAEGGSNYLQLKSLEVQLKQTERWNGQLPTVSSGVAPLIDAGRFLNK
jgi:regulator of protease activity HflC (stomatin/prohibitin superfamily)